MAVSFKGVGAFTAGIGAITPTFPTGNSAPSLNDIAILVVSSENEAISLTTANGFTEIGAQANKAAGTAAVNPASRLAVYWKRCTGSDSAPVVADSGDNTTAQIYLFSGCAVNGNPWNTYTEGNDSAANDLSGLIPGGTTTVDNCLIFLICSSSYNGTSTAQFSAWTNASLVSITESADNTNTAGLGSGHGSAYGIKATAGAYNDTTVTLAQTSYKGTMSIALRPELFPTVAINSPADASSTTDTTPSLQFTGIDGNADTLEYQVQIHTSNDFGAFDIQAPVKQQVDSFDAGIYGITFRPDGLKQYIPGATSIYQHVVRNPFDLLSTNHNRETTFSLASQGSTPVGIEFNNDGTKFYAICASNYTMFQYALTNPYDFTSGATYASKSLVLDTNCTNFWWKPDGTKLYITNRVTNIIKQFSLSTAYDISTATLEKTSSAIGSGWTKGIVFSSDGTKIIGVDAMNHNLVQYALSTAWDITTWSQTKTFSISADIGDYCSLWINTTGDILIARTDTTTIKYELHNPTLKADSTSDTGFTDVTNSGDTHPFASGDQIDYTVQSALSLGTYYWRVRAKDTTGRNQWGDWSAVRSLTIGSGNSQISGASTGLASTSGSLKGKGKIYGSTLGVSVVSATLRKRVRIAGASAGLSTISGAIKAKGKLYGSVSGGSVVSGTLRKKVRIAGLTTGYATVSGAIKARGKISGNILAISTVSGVIKAKGKVQGAVLSASTVSGILGAKGKVQGTILSVSTVSGAAKGRGKIVGVLVGISTVSGALKAKGKVQGDAQGVSTITANLRAKSNLQGSAQGISTVTGSIKGKGKIEGNITTSSIAIAILTGKGIIYGSTSGIASVTGVISEKQPGITGHISGSSVVIGTLRGKAEISGNINCTSVVLGSVKGIAIIYIEVPIFVKCPLTYQIRGKTALTTIVKTVNAANTELNLNCKTDIVLYSTNRAGTQLKVTTKII